MSDATISRGSETATNQRRCRPLDPEPQAFVEGLVQQMGVEGACRWLQRKLPKTTSARLIARLPVNSGTHAIVRELQREREGARNENVAA